MLRCVMDFCDFYIVESTETAKIKDYIAENHYKFAEKMHDHSNFGPKRDPNPKPIDYRRHMSYSVMEKFKHQLNNNNDDWEDAYVTIFPFNREKMYTKSLVIIGDIKCGKGAFAQKLTDATFVENYTNKSICDNESVRYNKFERNINIAMKQKTLYFKCFVVSPKLLGYIKKGRFVIVLYSITDFKTFDTAKSLLQSTVNANAIIMLVGNKTDLETQRVVSTDIGEQLASEYDVGFCEISVKNDDLDVVIRALIIGRSILM